jgi:hypothetical protein
MLAMAALAPAPVGLPAAVQANAAVAAPDAFLKDVWLIDDDQSKDWPACADYQGVYTTTLEALGLTYDVFEVSDYSSQGARVIPFDQAPSYSMVVYFTGDGQDGGNCGPSLTYNASGMAAYLTTFSGRLLITGKGIAARDRELYLQYGVTFNPELYFASTYVTRSIPYGAEPVLGAPGAYFLGRTYAITPGTNQFPVNQIAQVPNANADPQVILTLADTQQNTAAVVGTALSAEPTLERLSNAARAPEAWTPLPFRASFASFGVEGVADGAARRELLGRLLGFLREAIAVEVDAPATVALGAPVAIGAFVTPTNSIDPAGHGLTNTATLFRWDGGDGTIVTTTQPSFTALYTATGPRTVRVEATDSYGHRAVANRAIVVQARLYVPIVLQGT